jgi:hypothetical protein
MYVYTTIIHSLKIKIKPNASGLLLGRLRAGGLQFEASLSKELMRPPSQPIAG